MSERESIEAAIAALQAQRALLGDAVVDAALPPMHEQLARLASPVPGVPPEQALKQVSVLFLDVVGSTALSQHLDPEEIHAVMDGALERCTEVVRAHGGKVLQYAGDSLLAAFGAEKAQEDDAERAVRCGLALQGEGRALGEQVKREHGHDGCHVRVGIHTGPVLLGGGINEEGTIRGLTVNIAARMEQTAPAGRLRISHDTWLLVRGGFDAELQPALQVKGRDEPLVTYLVQRARQRAFRVPSRGIEGALPMMVGRDDELARLAALLAGVVAQRRLHAVTVIGEPGLGKSRLLHELQGVLETHAQRFWLLLGRAHPQSHLQPYGLLRDLLAWRLQIADSDASATAKVKLVDGLVPWFAERGEAKAHLIGHLIGLPFGDSPHVHGLEPRQLRALAFSALHDYLRGLAADGSVLALLLEDLQWADDGSLDFITELQRDAADLPLALVATARPELLERRADWAQGSALHLGALDTTQSEVLARALLRRIAAGAEPIRELLIAQADGNPFYMEELVRMLIDDGVIATDGDHWRVHPDKLRAARVPTTLVGVLQARIDALPAAARQALQQASIVGYVFWDDAVAALDPRAVASMPALQGRALIQQHEGSAFEGTLEEAFKHHLMQQVTYDTVLKPARRAGHAAAAQWLAARVGDRPAEYLAITAEHYDRAGDHAKAFDYFDRAAHDAQRRFANQASLDYAQKALNNPQATDLRLRNRLHELQTDVADLMGQRVLQEAALADRAVIADTLDDDALRADLLISRALFVSRRGDETLSFELATQAADLAARSGNADAGALALGQMAWARHSQGEGAAARRHAQDAVASVREALRGEDTAKRRLLEVQTLTLLAITETATGDHRQATATLLEALALARVLGSRRPQASILQTLASLDIDVGRYAQAQARLEECLAIACEVGWTLVSATARLNMARCCCALGNTARAAELVQVAQAEALSCESPDIAGRCMLLRGCMAAAAGDAERAQAAFEQASAVFEKVDAVGFICQVRARSAELHLAQGRLAQAVALTERVATDLAAGMALSVTDEPLFPRLLCHRVWARRSDPRAAQAIATVHAELQALAARAGDDETRRSILEDVHLHREIVAAWAAAKSH